LASDAVSLVTCHLQIWREYDTDGSGYIEADELKVSLHC
jgi:hypothetical protein